MEIVTVMEMKLAEVVIKMMMIEMGDDGSDMHGGLADKGLET